MDNVNKIIIHQPEPGVWYKFPNEVPPKESKDSLISIEVLICKANLKDKKIKPDDLYMDYLHYSILKFHNNEYIKEAYWQVPKLPLGFYYATFETFL